MSARRGNAYLYNTVSVSAAEDTLMMHITAMKLPVPEREFRFHPTRKWRFDLAWQNNMIAVEVQGGVWLADKGGHTSGAGRTRDMEKSNHAILLGWKVFQFSPEMIKSGEAIGMIEIALHSFPEVSATICKARIIKPKNLSGNTRSMKGV